MKDIAFINLLVISAISLIAPLALGLMPKIRVPAVVVEIVVGIVLGPTGFGWVKIDLPVQVLSLLGFAFLLFLAGLEIDLHRLRGRTLQLAVLGYAISFVIGLAAGYGFNLVGWVHSPLLVGVALAATSSGLVVSLLSDSGHTGDDIGQTIIAAVAVADFGAVLLLSLAFPTAGGSASGRAVLLAAFGLLVAVTGVVVWLASRSRELGNVLTRLQDTAAEVRVRGAMLLLVGFAALAEKFGLEDILGAFLAGALIGVVDRDGSNHPQFRTKLDAIGNGFLIPVFFISSGLRLDLRDLVTSPAALLRVVLFLAALLVVRGLPALLYWPTFGRRGTTAIALLQATSLPVIVSATQIGVQVGLITPLNAGALTCAGVLSVLLFPAAGVRLLRARQDPGAEGEDATSREVASNGSIPGVGVPAAGGVGETEGEFPPGM
ncbi:cation:proton antiporter [Streptomyces sp. NBC_01497]|uniref:cation:proton antiporter n=1 Tax=Streptomyces sp. NBC_01497 TaxID=2903885 RepID=UPI002E34FFDC|nr:cation:proton antiporter [Streptomyces sp. NBC_01497]